MIKYGGIYSDVDVIWTKAPSLTMRSYEAVASFDWAHSYHPYPNYINLGVSMGQRGSHFWRLFCDSMKTFRDDIFGFNGLLQPYKIYERRPDTIHMDDHLQVGDNGLRRGLCTAAIPFFRTPFFRTPFYETFFFTKTLGFSECPGSCAEATKECSA